MYVCVLPMCTFKGGSAIAQVLDWSDCITSQAACSVGELEPMECVIGSDVVYSLNCVRPFQALMRALKATQRPGTPLYIAHKTRCVGLFVFSFFDTSLLLQTSAVASICRDLGLGTFRHSSGGFFSTMPCLLMHFLSDLLFFPLNPILLHF